MSNPSPNGSQLTIIAPQQPNRTPNRLLFKALAALIALAFSILFIMVLIKLPGSF